MLTSPRSGERRFFTRELREADRDTRIQLVKELKLRGIDINKTWFYDAAVKRMGVTGDLAVALVTLNIPFKKDDTHTHTHTHTQTQTQIKKRKLTRVVWTDQEKNILAERIWRERVNNPDASIAELANMSMQVLPPNRQRKLCGTAQVRELCKLISKIDNKMLTSISSLQDKIVKIKELEQNVEAMEELLDQCKPQAMVATLPNNEVVAAIADRFSDVAFLKILTSAMPVDMLAEVFPVSVLSTAYLTAVQRAANANANPNTATNNSNIVKPVVKHESRKLRIAIVGLINSQIEKLKGKFSDLVIQGFEKNNLSGMSSNDVLFIASSFTPVSIQNAAKNAMGSKPVIAVTGSTVSLADAIENFALTNR
jgi:tetrahydromethanopterin S-methyltransferase subunit B